MTHVYLLGAGFTRAVLGECAPLTRELMSKLNISKFPEIVDEYERAFPDIEQFLTTVDLRTLHFQRTNDSLSTRFTGIRQEIIRQIVSLVDVDALPVNNDLAKVPLLRDFVKQIPTDACVLTLNYDCVLDQGLWLSKRWDPRGGYHLSSFPSLDNKNASKDRILLLKLHGSCNFKDVEKGQNYPNVEISPRIFRDINSNINGDDSDTPHVLVMSYVKQFRNGIMRLWRKAIDALNEAEKLIIVGCSLREEDTFLRFALYHFGMKERTDKFYADIIDQGRENCRTIKQKLMGLVACPDKQQVECFPRWLRGVPEKIMMDMFPSLIPRR